MAPSEPRRNHQQRSGQASAQPRAVLPQRSHERRGHERHRDPQLEALDLTEHSQLLQSTKRDQCEAAKPNDVLPPVSKPAAKHQVAHIRSHVSDAEQDRTEREEQHRKVDRTDGGERHVRASQRRDTPIPIHEGTQRELTTRDPTQPDAPTPVQRTRRTLESCRKRDRVHWRRREIRSAKNPNPSITAPTDPPLPPPPLLPPALFAPASPFAPAAPFAPASPFAPSVPLAPLAPSMPLAPLAPPSPLVPPSPAAPLPPLAAPLPPPAAPFPPPAAPFPPAPPCGFTHTRQS